MKRWKKVAMTATAAALASSMVLGMAACGPDDGGDDNAAHNAISQAVYDEVFGEFYDLYMEARAIVGSTDEDQAERYAKMAVAEAKLLNSATFSPLTSNGGQYAIGRLVPHTYTYVLWGNDMYRYHQALVTQELLAVSDREHVTEMYAQAQADGDTAAEYSAAVRAYLEGQGYHIKDTFTRAYNQDPSNYDVLATSMSVDSEALVNTYDGLMEYDEMSVLQPALADSYTVSEDNLTYTFHIRDGASWYNQSGDRYADVTADDFVAGFQHMLDAAGGLEYLVQGVVAGASEYIAGTADFDQVGVKQVNENGEPDENGEYVQYTLEQETPYFMTMLSYSVFAPMNRAYFLSQGGGFGADYDETAEDYDYGKSASNILYCGPYRITNSTNRSTIVFSSYEGYWNYDNINLKTIKWLFNDGQDVTKAYTDVKAGTIDNSGLSESNIVSARSEKTTDIHGNSGTYFDLYHYVGQNDAATGMGFYNLNREAFANFNDATVAVSPKADDVVAQEVTRMAMQNVHFRRALTFAFDRKSWNTARSGADLALNNLINSFTPGTFVQLPVAVTVDINGTATSFPAGTYYGEIVQAQLDADNSPIVAWNPEADGGIGSSFGFDGWYHPEEAKAEMALAIEELNGQTVVDAEGNPVLVDGEEVTINISASNPVQIDYVNVSTVTVWNNMASAYEKSIEGVLDEINVNLVAVNNESQWYYSGYYGQTGSDKNFDIDTTSLWAPDYGDPSTYLDTVTPTGYMITSFGLW